MRSRRLWIAIGALVLVGGLSGGAWWHHQSSLTFPAPGVFRLAGRDWMVEPAPEAMEWEAAKLYCVRLSLDGGGWYLPSRAELSALADARTRVDRVNSIPGINSDWYWSSSPDDATHAWQVAFGVGLLSSNVSRSLQHLVRCKR